MPKLTRPELQALQRLYVELLYVQSLAAEFQLDAASVCRRYGLEPECASLLPEVTAPGFAAEVHGRRVLNARQLVPIFEATLRTYFGALEVNESELTRRLTSSSLLSEFHGSPHFLSSAHSLKSGYGIGRAADLGSRFYFWARAAKQLDQRTLSTDFGVFLLREASVASEPTIRAFQSGVYFRACGELVIPLLGGQAPTLPRELESELLARGFHDLDRITP